MSFPNISFWFLFPRYLGNQTRSKCVFPRLESLFIILQPLGDLDFWQRLLRSNFRVQKLEVETGTNPNFLEKLLKKKDVFANLGSKR